MKLSIQLEMPPPQQEQAQEPKQSIEDKVREAVELCESGYCSHTEWLMLQKLCKALKGREQTPRVQNLLEMVQPLLNKYGYYDLTNQDDRESTSGHDTPTESEG